MTTRVLVTGAGGFIGHHLVRYLLERGHWVRAVDAHPPEYDSSPAHEFNALDLRREDDAYPAEPEEGYGWEKLFTEKLCRYYREDFGLDTRVARFHNVYGPLGTYDGGREKSPAAICRKVALAADGDEIEVWGDG